MSSSYNITISISQYKCNCIFRCNFTIFCLICNICFYYFCRHIYHVSRIWIFSNFLQPTIKLVSSFIWSSWYKYTCRTIIILSIIMFIIWIYFYHRCSIFIYKCHFILIYCSTKFCFIYYKIRYYFTSPILDNCIWITLCPSKETITILRICCFSRISWFNGRNMCSYCFLRNFYRIR